MIATAADVRCGGGMAGPSGRIAVPGRASRGHLQLELVQALAVVGHGHQAPLAGHLVEAAQGEAGEAEHRPARTEERRVRKECRS